MIINSRNQCWFLIALLTCLSTLCLQDNVYAQSDLPGIGVSPKRVVIPTNQRSTSITLTNSSEAEISYRMSLIEMGLDAGGQFRTLADGELPENYKSAKPHIRFSPRQVRLKPGETQVVRAIVMGRNKLAPGEYRSHLKLLALPTIDSSSLGNAGAGEAVLVQASSGVGIGITIPVIIRHGKTDSVVTLKESVLKASGDQVSHVDLLLGLEGDRSTYGDIHVQLVQGSSRREIALIRGFALYQPFPQERLSIPIKGALKKSDISEISQLRVIFNNREADNERTTWLDDTQDVVIQQSR